MLIRTGSWAFAPVAHMLGACVGCESPLSLPSFRGGNGGVNPGPSSPMIVAGAAAKTRQMLSLQQDSLHALIAD